MPKPSFTDLVQEYFDSVNHQDRTRITSHVSPDDRLYRDKSPQGNGLDTLLSILSTQWSRGTRFRLLSIHKLPGRDAVKVTTSNSVTGEEVDSTHDYSLKGGGGDTLLQRYTRQIRHIYCKAHKFIKH
ncbi:hypothetical protein V8C35DRAFT_297225 [Trichoderma chlorosporum]